MEEKGDVRRGVLLFVRLGKQRETGQQIERARERESRKVETRAFVAIRQTLALFLALTKAPWYKGERSLV